VLVAQEPNGRNGGGFGPGTRAILRELRDLRVEMRADRRQFAQEAARDRRQAAEDRRQAGEDRRRSDARFEQLLQAFRDDSARREATTQKMFKDIRTVGLAIVKTLNRHTRLLEHISEHHGRLLERIDRKLGARDNGRPGPGNGRRT
jgi:hypothetical protein